MDGKSKNGEDETPQKLKAKSGNGENKHPQELAGKSRKGKDKRPEQHKEDTEVARTLLSFLDPKAANDIRRDLLPKAVQDLAGECSKFMKKQLKITDLREDLHRLTLKPDDVKKYLYQILSNVEKKKGKNNVSVYDFEGKDYQMDFKVLGDEKNYVLNSKNWVTFVNDHNLAEDQEITLWSFRHLNTKKLCFVIISERNDPATTSSATAPMKLPPALPWRQERRRRL